MPPCQPAAGWPTPARCGTVLGQVPEERPGGATSVRAGVAEWSETLQAGAFPPGGDMKEN